MKRLAKELKRYAWPIVFVILLLFVQAVSDLNLPNLMSDIVNTGIQQKGVENAAPEVLSEDDYNFVTAFMTDEQKQLTDESYTKTQPDALSDSLKKSFPNPDNKTVYVRNHVDKDTLSALDTDFGTAEWTFIQYMKDNGAGISEHIIAIEKEAALAPIKAQLEAAGIALNPDGSIPEAALAMLPEDVKAQMAAMQDAQNSAAAQQSSASTTDTTDMASNVENMDLSKVYALLPYLPQMPEDWMSTARTNAQTIQDSVREQTGAVFAGLFYKDIGADLNAMRTNYIIKIGLYMLGLSLLAAAASIGVGWLASRIAAGTSRSLRSQLFGKVESFSNVEFNRFSTASLITRSTNDVTQIQTLIVMGLRIMCYAPIIGIGGVIMALRQSTSMSWVIALAVILVLCVIGATFALMLPRFKITQKLVDQLNLVMRENLSGLSVVRAFGNQTHEQQRFKTENERVTKNNLFINRGMVFMMPLMMFIMNGVTLLIIWVGAHQIAEGTMQVGNMMAFMQYAMQIIMAFLMISMMFVMVPRAAVSADRIAEVLDTDPVIVDPKNAQPLDPTKRGIVFDHVDFQYEGADERVLKDISFTAEPGKTTAFIGPTGSGKSTLVNMIPRFYDVTGGSIRVDGTDIREAALHDLRGRIGYVPQKGILFSGTVNTNLRYGRPEASQAEVQAGAEIAQAMEFLTADPEGFERSIAQGGDNVSGGQKQRLSIARALVRKPEIYIFDDSFSALDFKTDAKLRAALADTTGDAAVLIVAQRINTIMHADQIIVLDEGEIVGCGTHEELLKTCEAYQDIARSQLTEEELQHA